MKIRIYVESVVGSVTGFFVGFHPLVQALVALMILDILSGLLAGYVTRTLDSAVSARGMAKKVFALILVAAAYVVASFVGLGIDLGPIVAGFYCVHELLSLVENAGRAELPVPKALLDALAKLQQKYP
ncbi:MAG TPA: phage holin family protein [Armatimonadota bacterium]|nr:phage holin family protein [Armatimonadota bacterium]